jgi:hypothetical protein
MNNCSYCSTKLFEKDRYCPSCGAPILNFENKTYVRGGVGNPLLFIYEDKYFPDKETYIKMVRDNACPNGAI